MSKTNFDDIDLGGRGIEAGEINSESATAGQVLTAEGAGGAGWGGGGLVCGMSWPVLSLEDVEVGTGWVNLGLAGVGLPSTAKAVLLVLTGYADGNDGRIFFRPTGSGLGAVAERVNCLPVVSGATEQACATLVVPCGSGAVEYTVQVQAGGAMTIYGSVIGYWL